MKPLRDLVLLQLEATRGSVHGTRDDGSTFALYMPAIARHEQPYGTVLALGCDAVAPGLHVGSIVLFDESRAIRADSNDTLRVGHAATGNALERNGPGQVLVALPDIIATIEQEASK